MDMPAPERMGSPSKRDLHKRIIDLELTVARLEDHINQMELSYLPPPIDPALQELRTAVIQALYAVRSQGAYAHAKMLESKYFDGIDQQAAGDVVNTSEELARTGGSGTGTP